MKAAKLSLGCRLIVLERLDRDRRVSLRSRLFPLYGAGLSGEYSECSVAGLRFTFILSNCKIAYAAEQAQPTCR